jgi:hypothetical protein
MSTQPEWWLRAKELEQDERIEEAEAVIKEALAPQGYPWPAQSAQLHLERMQRLLKEGRYDEAKAAAVNGINWMYSFASGATSGGEGAAFMYQVEQFKKEVHSDLEAHGLSLEE